MFKHRIRVQHNEVPTRLRNRPQFALRSGIFWASWRSQRVPSNGQWIGEGEVWVPAWSLRFRSVRCSSWFGCLTKLGEEWKRRWLSFLCYTVELQACENRVAFHSVLCNQTSPLPQPQSYRRRVQLGFHQNPFLA